VRRIHKLLKERSLSVCAYLDRDRALVFRVYFRRFSFSCFMSQEFVGEGDSFDWRNYHITLPCLSFTLHILGLHSGG
jgi:hypothetical protein